MGHEILHTRHRLAQSLGLRPESLWFQVAGINHLPWITAWRIGNQDGHGFLREWLAQHGARRYAKDNLVNTCDSVFEDRHAVKFSLFEVYGVLAGAGDRHGVELTTIAHRQGRHARERTRLLRCLAGEGPLPLEHSVEEIAELIVALQGGRAAASS